MASRRDVGCRRCGMRMLVQPDVRGVRCFNCRTIINLNQLEALAPPPLPRQLARAPPSAHGRKRAVVCGINYRYTKDRLCYSVNDALTFRSFLIHRMGFPIDSIRTLTDQRNEQPERVPTKENILRAMKWLVRGCQTGDSLVFFFSGHGTSLEDKDGDEDDGMDEALCPVDEDIEGAISDDKINTIMIRPLPHGVKFHAFIDACHSGTVLDLPYVWKRIKRGRYEYDDHTSHIYKGTSGGEAFCLSCCEDDRFAPDSFDGRPLGALTYSFIKVATSKSRLTYCSLLDRMHAIVDKVKSNSDSRLLGSMRAIMKKAKSNWNGNHFYDSDEDDSDEDDSDEDDSEGSYDDSDDDSDDYSDDDSDDLVEPAPQLSSSLEFNLYSRRFVL